MRRGAERQALKRWADYQEEQALPDQLAGTHINISVPEPRLTIHRAVNGEHPFKNFLRSQVREDC